jgi:hypothetical protein
MPFNGSGTFMLVTGNPVVTGTVISSTVHNNTNNDIASGLTNCITRDGQSAPSGNLPMGGFKHTGAADATANGQYLTYGQGVRAADLASITAPGGSTLVGQLDSVTGAVGITQAAYLNLNVKGLKKTFGAVGDGVAADDVAFAAALASGKIIEAEEGTFVITSAKTYNTSGFGRGLQLYGWGIEKTKFDNRVASNPMLSISGAGTPSQYAYSLQLKNFQILTTTSPVSSIGLKLRSQWGGVIEQVKVNGLTSHGIQLQNDDGDPDASAFLTLDQVFLMSNGGWGLHCTDPVTLASATGDVKLLQTYITGNALGGVRAVGIQWLLEHVTFAQNLAGGGLVVPFIASPSSTMAHLNVFGCDFDDNANYHIDVQACKQGEVAQTKFIYRANGVGIRIGDGGGPAPSRPIPSDLTQAIPGFWGPITRQVLG